MMLPWFHGSRKKSVRRALAFSLFAFLCLGRSLPAADTASAPRETNPAAEAAYTQTLEKRVADILAVLGLQDPAKCAKIHDCLVAQYRGLRDWHDAHDAARRTALPQQASQIDASLKQLHDQFLAHLAAELPPEQIERIKDKMTYNKVKVTYDAYCEIIPGLSEPEKQRILQLLKEAREEGMDGGSSKEKDAIFKKYKGKINNYLSSQGHDVNQAYKDWGAKQKAKTGQSNQPAPKPRPD